MNNRVMCVKERRETAANNGLIKPDNRVGIIPSILKSAVITGVSRETKRAVVLLWYYS